MAARSFPTWIITQEPRMVPNRKGPFHDDKYVEELLRDAYQSNPDIICIVIDNPSEAGWSPQHGHEWLDMYGDGRKRHPRKDRPKRPPQANVTVKRWLLEEHLPGGSVRWQCFEHERECYARHAASGNPCTITPLVPAATEGSADASS